MHEPSIHRASPFLVLPKCLRAVIIETGLKKKNCSIIVLLISLFLMQAIVLVSQWS